MPAFLIVSALSDKSLGGRPDTIRNGVEKQVVFDAWTACGNCSTDALRAY